MTYTVDALKLFFKEPRMFTEKALLLKFKKTITYEYTSMPIEAMEINDQLREISNNFNLYRQRYSQLNFEELKKLNYAWYIEYPTQKYIDFVFVKSAIRYLIKRLHKKELLVEEMGGYQGELAYMILKDFSKISWKNFEVIPHRQVRDLSKYIYQEIVLDAYLWQADIDLSGCDLFIMSDTFEHFTDKEAMEILNMLNSSKVKSVIIKSPLSRLGQTWNDYLGSHLLEMGSDQLKSIMAKDYQLEKQWGECFFWVRKHL